MHNYLLIGRNTGLRPRKPIMEEKLVPRLMDRESAVQAFPLVRDLLPNVSLEQWIRFARPLLSSHSAKCPRGLMTIQNGASYILALFGFEVRESLTETRALWIDNIIVPNIPGRDMIWEAVMDAAEYLARMNGCRTIRAGFADELDPAHSERLWVKLSFERSGYSLDGMQALKRLNPGPTPIHNH
jgi:hypothetical protein